MPEGRTLVAGHAAVLALVLEEPLSFWGGIDPATGALIDTHHPQQGASVTGRILVMPSGRVELGSEVEQRVEVVRRELDGALPVLERLAR